MRPKSVMSWLNGEAAGGAIVDDGIVERARGDAAVLVRAHGGQIGDCVGQFAGAGFARDLRLGELQQVSDADVGIVLDGHPFGIGQGEAAGRSGGGDGGGECSWSWL